MTEMARPATAIFAVLVVNSSACQGRGAIPYLLEGFEGNNQVMLDIPWGPHAEEDGNKNSHSSPAQNEIRC